MLNFKFLRKTICDVGFCCNCTLLFIRTGGSNIGLLLCVHVLRRYGVDDKQFMRNFIEHFTFYSPMANSNGQFEGYFLDKIMMQLCFTAQISVCRLCTAVFLDLQVTLYCWWLKQWWNCVNGYIHLYFLKCNTTYSETWHNVSWTARLLTRSTRRRP